MRTVVLLFATLSVAACSKAPPITSPSGEAIERVTFEESFPLSDDVKEASLRGERLRDGVALMEKHRVLTMTGEHRASGVLDKSTLTIIVKPAAGEERRVSFRSCSVENVCAFFEEASARGLVERKPLVCRNATPCEKPQSARRTPARSACPLQNGLRQWRSLSRKPCFCRLSPTIARRAATIVTRASSIASSLSSVRTPLGVPSRSRRRRSPTRCRSVTTSATAIRRST